MKNSNSKRSRNSATHTVKKCNRCFLYELDREKFQSIYDYIDLIPPEQKTPEEEYQRRLALCRECHHLLSGMCQLCGCFVEVRAAKRQNICSMTQGKW